MDMQLTFKVDKCIPNALFEHITGAELTASPSEFEGDEQDAELFLQFRKTRMYFNNILIL